jgi:hypothetical protein
LRVTEVIAFPLDLRVNRQLEDEAMGISSLPTRPLSAVLTALLLFALSGHRAAAEETLSKSGLTVYLGVVPSEIVKGPSPHSAEPPIHGRIPKGPHAYHIVAAIFDASTGARVSDANVTAQVSGLGLSGTKKTLEPMEIAGTITYGGFFDLPGFDLYTVRLAIERPGAAQTVVLNFKYDHRR